MIKLGIILCAVSMLLTPDIDTGCIKDRCDYIEINEFGQTYGSRTQIIFWEWRDSGVAHIQRKKTGEPTGLVQYGGGFVVVDYKMMKCETHSGGVRPLVSHKKKGVTVVFWDRSDDVVREVSAKWIVYTECRDPEQANLKIFASEHRKGLTDPETLK